MKSNEIFEAANMAQQAAIAINMKKHHKKPKGLREADEEYSPVVQAITRRIMRQHVDLLSKYGPDAVMRAIEEVGEFVGDVEEIGTSDVSAYVRQVERILQDNAGQGLAEAEDYTHGEPDGEMMKNSLHTIARVAKYLDRRVSSGDEFPEWMIEKVGQAKGMMTSVMQYITSEQEMEANGEEVYESLTPDQQFDIIEEMVEGIAQERGVDSEQIWEYFERVDDNKLFETAAWQKKSGKNKNGGLNRKGVASYRREHPGSKLQTAVTTKPSKLKPGSKAAKRRKSFCARMSGMPGPMKKPNGKPTRKALSLRKWNC